MDEDFMIVTAFSLGLHFSDLYLLTLGNVLDLVMANAELNGASTEREGTADDLNRLFHM